MSKCRENFPVWRVLFLFIACSCIYFYLYTNAFDGMRSTSVFRVVEGDLQAKFGSISYYLKLMEQPDKSLQIELSSKAVTSVVSNTTRKAEVNITTKAATTAKQTEPPDNLAALLDSLKRRIETNETIPLLTLFTSWNDSPDKNLVHNLTVYNWLSLRPYVIPVIFTNETVVADECRKRGWEVFPIRVGAADGIPVLKYMYSDVMEAFNTSFYAYCNGDILFTHTVMETLGSLVDSSVFDLTKPTMIVGKRTNVDNVTEEEGMSWSNISEIGKARGKLFTGYAEDFFITTRSYAWKDIPEVVIGRRAYDNWLIYNARKQKQVVVDATRTLLAVHQTTLAGNFEGHGHKNRDYNHNLLVKMYKRIKYGAGVVECIEQFTDYEKGSIIVKTRTVNKGCKC